MVEQHWDEAKIADVERRDKRRAAVHEAGHATVAAAKGLRARAWLYRSNTARPMEEKVWLGRAQVTGGDDPAYAIAGMVAEQLDWQHDVQSWQIIEEWESRGETEIGLSPTDIELVPQNWRSREVLVEEAMTILNDHKPLFDRIVLQLVEHECITDGMVANLIQEMRIAPAVEPPRKK